MLQFFAKLGLSLVVGALHLFAILPLLSGAAQAELAWQSSGPGGGGAFAAPAVSRDGQSVLVPSDLGGIYRSVNGGGTWQAIGSNKGLMTTHVDAVAIDPENSANVLAAGQGAIYRSTTCGPAGDCTFKPVMLPAATPSTLVTTVTYAVGDTVYAAGLDGWCNDGARIWHSGDGGQTWRGAAAKGLPATANIMAIRVQRNRPQTLIAISARARFTGCGDDSGFAAQAPNRAYLSLDGGENFAPLEIAASNPRLEQKDAATEESWAYIEDVKFDAADPARVWVTVTANPDQNESWAIDGELWSTASLAVPFKRQAEGHTGQLWPLSNGRVRTLDLRRQYPWDRGETGVWEYHATAKTWSRMTTDKDYLGWDRGWLTDPESAGAADSPGADAGMGADLGAGMGESLNGGLHTITPVDDATLWWATSQFVFSTADGGRRFRQQFTTLENAAFRSRGIDNAVPAALAPDAIEPAVLYAGYFDMGCWRSTDAHASAPGWRDCNGPKSRGPDYSPSPWNGGWKGHGGNTTALAVDPETPGTLWMVQSTTSSPAGPYKIAKSSDHGVNLEDVTFDLGLPGKAGDAAITALAVTIDGTARTLWAIAGNHLFNLPDGAESWVRQSTPCDGGMMVLAVSKGRMYVGGGAGTCTSADAGRSWVKWHSPWMGNTTTTWWHDGQMIDGVYESYRGVTDFAIDPSDDRRAWMTVMIPDTDHIQNAAGLHMTRDGGQSWQKIVMPQHAARGMNFARTVAVSPVNPDHVVVGSSTALISGGLLLPGELTGVWVTRDGGKTWSAGPENSGLAYPFMTKLRFSARPSLRLWGISPGQGVVFSQAP